MKLFVKMFIWFICIALVNMLLVPISLGTLGYLEQEICLKFIICGASGLMLIVLVGLITLAVKEW